MVPGESIGLLDLALRQSVALLKCTCGPANASRNVEESSEIRCMRVRSRFGFTV